MKKKLSTLTVEGYSRAGKATYFYLPQHRIAFDCGRSPDTLLKGKYLFLTHMHHDHCAGLLFWLGYRSLVGMAPLPVYMPESAVKPLEELMKRWEEITQKSYPRDFHAVQEGEDIFLSRRLLIRPFATTHRIPSFGYTLLERRETLRKEYRGLAGEEIARLREKGEKVVDQQISPILSYTGDTTPEVFHHHPQILQSPVLITECTYIEEKHRDLAPANGHTHLEDLAFLSQAFTGEHLLLAHFSLRYSPGRIRRRVQEVFSRELWEKTHLWLEE